MGSHVGSQVDISSRNDEADEKVILPSDREAWRRDQAAKAISAATPPKARPIGCDRAQAESSVQRIGEFGSLAEPRRSNTKGAESDQDFARFSRPVNESDGAPERSVNMPQFGP